MGYEIRKSILDDSGLGVFTTKNFKPNQINIRFDGIILDERQWSALSYEDSAYVMAFERGARKEFYVDASHPNSCVARYINHGGGTTSNVVQKFEGDKIIIRNPQFITKNSELYLNYSSDYFNDDERIITPPIDSIGPISNYTYGRAMSKENKAKKRVEEFKKTIQEETKVEITEEMIKDLCYRTIDGQGYNFIRFHNLVECFGYNEGLGKLFFAHDYKKILGFACLKLETAAVAAGPPKKRCYLELICATGREKLGGRLLRTAINYAKNLDFEDMSLKAVGDKKNPNYYKLNRNRYKEIGFQDALNACIPETYDNNLWTDFDGWDDGMGAWTMSIKLNCKDEEPPLIEEKEEEDENTGFTWEPVKSRNFRIFGTDAQTDKGRTITVTNWNDGQWTHGTRPPKGTGARSGFESAEAARDGNIERNSSRRKDRIGPRKYSTKFGSKDEDAPGRKGSKKAKKSIEKKKKSKKKKKKNDEEDSEDEDDEDDEDDSPPDDPPDQSRRGPRRDPGGGSAGDTSGKEKTKKTITKKKPSGEKNGKNKRWVGKGEPV